MTNQNFITVKFAKQFPGKLNEFVLNGNRTLRALLEENQVISATDSVREMDVRVNGQKVQLDHQLNDGDIVLIFSLIKGNQGDFITVRVGKAPGGAPEAVVVAPFSTVAQAMVVAEIRDGVYDLFVNDVPADAGTQLRNGDLVIIKNSSIQIGEGIGDEYAEDYENREAEVFGEEETPSQKLYQFAETTGRKSKLLRKVAQACDESEEFENLMFTVFGPRSSRW